MPTIPIQRSRVLVVDSDAERLIALEQMLESAGFDTTTTWDVRTAGELLAGNKFDLALIGEHPPEITCSDVLETVQSKHPDMPCIIMRSKLSGLEVETLSPGARSIVPACTLSDVVATITYCLIPFSLATTE